MQPGEPAPNTRTRDSNHPCEQQSDNNMAVVSETNIPRYNPTAQVVQWLAEIEPGEPEEGQQPPSIPSSTASGSPPSKNNAEPAKAPAALPSKPTTARVPSPPPQQFVYKWVRRGAMLGIGGSGGWVPASYVRIRVPVAVSATAVSEQQSQPLSPPKHQNAAEDTTGEPRAQDQGNAQVALRPVTGAQGMSDAGGSTCHVDDKPRR